jgi:hypothetical protein
MIRMTAALILIVGTGLVHGAWTNRWGPSRALAALAARLDSVPMVIGDWEAMSYELDAWERAKAGASACLGRVYRNPASGASVTVLLLGGLPGDITTHTPDACYPGAGYTLDSPSAYDLPYGVDSRDLAGFRTAVARRGGTSPSVLRIFWSWNASKGWVAPDDARWRFAHEPALCKLYIVRETAGDVVDPGADPCNEFLNVFLPEFDRSVFSAPDVR